VKHVLERKYEQGLTDLPWQFYKQKALAYVCTYVNGVTLIPMQIWQI